MNPRDPVALEPPAPPPLDLAVLRTRFRDGKRALIAHFMQARATAPAATRLIKALTRHVDATLADLWHHCGMPASAALLAVGGYGRGELLPHSDVDVLLLLPDDASLLTGSPLPEHHSEVIEDQDWERSWMDNFQPMRFGQRLWIVPSWHAAPEPNAVNLLLDPGLAYGTGTHPTTALCLEWLDGQDLTDSNVLDFGCGSGILAIAALLLGAKEAVGTDIDVQALEASRDNAGRNNIAEGKFPLYLPEDLPQVQADVLVANILAGPLVSLAPQLSSLVKPGGRLALSGILAEQGEDVAAAYAKDFELDPIANRDGWVRISGRRR